MHFERRSKNTTAEINTIADQINNTHEDQKQNIDVIDATRGEWKENVDSPQEENTAHGVEHALGKTGGGQGGMEGARETRR